MFYISENEFTSVTKIEYINTPFNGAHKIMKMELAEEQDIGKGYWKMNSSV